jgi:tetratricopeptide (TPR) repeat protein
MVKIIISIFKTLFSLFLLLQSSLAAEVSRKKEVTTALKNQIFTYHRSDEETSSIPYLERYLELSPSEIYFKLLYAKALLYRNDLEVPKNDEAIESRINKNNAIQANYTKSAKIFQENVTHLQKIRPRDSNLGRWLYLWAFSEWFSDNKEKAIKLFQKSVKQDYRLTEAYYNIAALYESLGQWRDAELYWRKYEKAEREKEEED